MRGGCTCRKRFECIIVLNSIQLSRYLDLYTNRVWNGGPYTTPFTQNPASCTNSSLSWIPKSIHYDFKPLSTSDCNGLNFSWIDIELLFCSVANLSKQSRIQGRGLGPPLFLDQTAAPLISGSGWPEAPPLSEGLDSPLLSHLAVIPVELYDISRKNL